jgi:hypothetical protein
MPENRTLLAVVELGGYPNFQSLYESQGYSTEVIMSGRRVLNRLKKDIPDVIVAEFNPQSDFRDRTSALESVLAVAQREPSTRCIVFFNEADAGLLEPLRARFPFFEPISYPITEEKLKPLLA